MAASTSCARLALNTNPKLIKTLTKRVGRRRKPGFIVTSQRRELPGEVGE
jgi:hypothetical protein